MLDQIIILQDSAQRLSTTYNSLTYRVVCTDSSLRDLANAIKAVSGALDTCRGLLEQLGSATPKILIPLDLSPRLEANLEECKESFEDASDKAKKLMPQGGFTKALESFAPAELQRLTSRLHARERDIYRVVQAVKLQTTSQLQQTPRNTLSNARQPFGQPLQLRYAQPGFQFQAPRLQPQFSTININEKAPRTGHTVLHDMCTTSGKSEKTTAVIKSLLEKGADPTATLAVSFSMLTAVHIASYHNNVAALEAIKESMTTSRTLTYTPQFQTSIINTQYKPINYTGQWKWKSLLKQKDFQQMTALHWAATGICPEAMDFLLKEVEDAGLAQEMVDGKDRGGKTPLIVLASNYRLGDRDAVTKVAKALVKAGASSDVADMRGQTPKAMLVGLGIDKPGVLPKEQQVYGGATGNYGSYGGYQGYNYQSYQGYSYQGHQRGGQQSNYFPSWRGTSYQGGWSRG
ncbi:hypothetical protein QBC41DRAFT_42399 [Cercophora samala]|uniref:Ankyrin repeat protein n=1 Tax=Cercophora samala TaxID=330535 RepID=A0AA39ZIX4_9PEZI|nr:hypothetical protein QBC41DRAFT_42399 [Cercophora samala]